MGVGVFLWFLVQDMEQLENGSLGIFKLFLMIFVILLDQKLCLLKGYDGINFIVFIGILIMILD